MKWCFTHDVRWWDESCPASRDECDEGCDVDTLIRAGDRVLYEKGDRCDKRSICTWQHAATDRWAGNTVHLKQVYPAVEE